MVYIQYLYKGLGTLGTVSKKVIMMDNNLNVLSYDDNSTIREELESQKVRIVSLSEYTKLLPELYAKVQYGKFDTIVAIGRGGTMIGSYLASKLGIPLVHSVFLRHVGRGKELKLVVDDDSQIKSLHGSLLIVDDWLCEGRAMSHVLNLLPKDAQKTTIVLFNRKGSEYKPDIVGVYVNEDERNIIFPYGPIAFYQY